MYTIDRKCNKKRLFFIVLTVLPCLLIPLMTLPMTYMTNDDSGIQAALNGSVTGKPYPYHQFINCFLGYMLCFLYQLLPSIEWWYVWSLLCIGLGICLIHWSFFKEASKKVDAVILIIIFAALFWIYIISNVAFTVVPCVLALGVICIFFVGNEHKWDWKIVLICSIALVIASWHRFSTIEAMLCYFLGGLLYYVIQSTNLTWKKKISYYLVTVVGVVSIILLTYLSSNLIKNHQNSDYFNEYNKARIAYMDYAKINYADMPEVFLKYDWDEDLTNMVGAWCFLDERFNPETINGILQDSDDVILAESEKTEFLNVLNTLMELIKTNRYAKMIAGLALLLILGEVLIILWGVGKSWNNIFYLGNMLGSFVLLIYLSTKGRLPLRAYLVILLPMTCIGLLLLLKIKSAIEEKSKKIFWYVSSILGIAIAVGGMMLNYDSLTVQSKKYNLLQSSEIIDYASERQDNIYIYSFDGYSSLNPQKRKTTNLLSWGGSTFHSDMFYRSLECLGLDFLDMNVFKRENVYLLTGYPEDGKVSASAKLLFDNLIDYGAVSVEMVDKIANIDGVYQYYFDEKLDNYTGFYSIGDYNFYYKNGERQTGVFQVGADYYLSGDDGIVLWNDQYINTKGKIDKKWEIGDYFITGEYYADGWMGNQVDLAVNANKGQNVSIKLDVSQEMMNCQLSVFSSDGSILGKFHLKLGENVISIKIPVDGVNYLNMKVDKVFRPNNADSRELSVYILGVEVQ